MGRTVNERTWECSPRHPTPRAPIPGPPVYLDAKDKDLPYDGCMKRPPARGPESSFFDQPLGLREEGAMLLAILTGVQGSPLQKLAPGMPGFSLLYGVGREGAKDSPRHVKGTMPSQSLKLELRMGAAAGLSANAEMRKKLQKNVSPIDECVDTSDLEELTAEKENEGASKSWLFDSVEEEELYKYSQDLDARTAAGGREISIKEYTDLIRKSAGRLVLRTQLLQDLCLAEDVDLGVTDLPSAPPPLPSLKPGALPTSGQPPATNTDKSDDPSKPKVAKDPLTGAMCATSLVVKKARRLAGLMHTEQQTTDLRDIWDWLQHLGTIAPPESRSHDSAAVDGSGRGTGKPEDQKQGDWRLPSSPALALIYAQEDLRQRLAHLYQEKNNMESRRLQLAAAKKLVGKVGDGEETKLLNYLHGLQTLEDGYETLGGKIADNLNDAENLDKRFQTLTQEAARESKSAKGGKGGKKGKKKGKKGKKGRKGDEDAEEEEKDDTGGTTGVGDSEADAKTEESEESDGEVKPEEKKKKKKGKGSKKSPPAVQAPAPLVVAEHKATSPLALSPFLHGEVSTVDQSCQTDDAALFSLMEKMFDDMEDEVPLEPEDEQTELRRLRREVKKLKVQLRFWRSRNWIEQHQHLISSNSSSPSIALPVDSFPSEAGFKFYFDQMRLPIPGMDGARAVHGSAPSNLSGRGTFTRMMSHSGRGGGPSSAPGNLHSNRPIPIPSPVGDSTSNASVVPSLPAGLRLTEPENQRPSNPLNLRLMASSAPRGSRAARGWSVRPQEPPPVFPPNSLVVLGRSSQLLTPRESTPHAIPVVQIGGNISPRRSNLQFQKA